MQDEPEPPEELDILDELLAAVPDALRRDDDEVAAVPATVARESRLAPGQQVGRFRIQTLVGEGGMGVVYRAQQMHPERTVALKIVRPELGGSRTARRFEYEADALGRLHHAGIAQIFDAGTVEIDGQPFPFISMELVEGRRLDTVSKEGSPTERLELLAKLCDAVDHAHRNGVIHRDLKPANVLVTSEGQPKVLDFGLARALDTDLMTTTLQTKAGELLGTVPYMSPEQATGDPTLIDHRTDIYSLGVIAHEMLVGRLPYELPDTSVLKALEIIRDRDPERLGSIRRELRGDVETIVLKALDKDRERRYPSAGALADDVRRFLTNQPVVARPASVIYQLGKFTRRHRGFVAGLGLALLALVVGLITSVTWYLRANENALRAEKEASEARAARASVERQLYRANLRSAEDALASGDVGVARKLLEQVAAEDNGWEWRHLESRLEHSIDAPIPAGWSSPFVEFSPSGTLVTARLGVDPASYERVVVRVDTQEEVLRIRGDGPAYFTPDDRWLFNRFEERLERWNLETGQQVAGLSVACLEGWPVALDPTRRRYAIGSQEGTEILDLDTDAHLHSIAGKALQLSYSADGAYLAIVDGAELRVFDVTSLDTSPEPFFTAEAGPALAFHPHAPVLALDTLGSQIHLLRIEDGTARLERSLGGLPGIASRLAWSSNGSLLAAGDGHGNLRLWSTRTGEPRNERLDAHNGWISSLAFLPGDRSLVSCASDSSIRVWSIDAESLNVLRGHRSYVYPLVVSPDGSRIVSGGWDGASGEAGALRVWDTATGAPIAAVGSARQKEIFLAADATPDGSSLLVSSWRIVEDTHTVQVLDPLTLQPRLAFRGHANIIERIAAHPDGRRVLSVDRDGSALLWELGTGQVLARHDLDLPKEMPGPGLGVDISPDGDLLALTAETTDIRLVDAESGEVVRAWRAHDEPIWCLAFTPDGERLLSAASDDTLRVWDVATGRRLATLLGHGQEVLCVAPSPDGTRIASGGRDGAVRIWDAENYDLLARLAGHEQYVYSLAWDPNGAWLASSSGDTTIRIWDTSPLAARYAARAERDTRLRAIEPVVARACATTSSPAEAAALLAEQGLAGPDRVLARQVVTGFAARFQADSKFAPEFYRAQRAPGAIDIDGRMDEPAWQAAPWTDVFGDIEGDVRPRPRFATRAKMLWDDEFFYVAADLEEPHVWGALTEHDSIVFHDNDFEIFIDPDRDRLHYYEIEINALETIFDLLLSKAYNRGGKADHGWTAEGMHSAVHVAGTLNDPSDVDRGWSTEFAIPFALFAELSDVALPPDPGDVWKLNFSRVQWQHVVEGDTYRKVPDTEEDNWVWSAQHAINMHIPEHWGYVEFTR